MQIPDPLTHVMKSPSEMTPRGIPALIKQSVDLMSKIPDGLILTLGRFSIAAVFWLSGQTKVDGFQLDIVHGMFNLGIPHLSDSAIDLFRNEYHLPLVPPEIAARLAAFAEHFFSALILLGLSTRFAALALLIMTLVIEIFVYPDAYPTHGVWATVLLLLMAKGPGKLSLDYLIARRLSGRNR